jgi:hypothetical protein
MTTLQVHPPDSNSLRASQGPLSEREKVCDLHAPPHALWPNQPRWARCFQRWSRTHFLTARRGSFVGGKGGWACTLCLTSHRPSGSLATRSVHASFESVDFALQVAMCAACTCKLPCVQRAHASCHVCSVHMQVAMCAACTCSVHGAHNGTCAFLSVSVSYRRVRALLAS